MILAPIICPGVRERESSAENYWKIGERGGMEKGEKVKEAESKRGLLVGEKLKRGALIGKREGNCTPSPTWKFGLIQPDGTLIQDFNVSSNSNALSARKLGANLWEMQPQINPRVAKMSKAGPILGHQRGKKILSDELNGAPADNPSNPPASSTNLGEQVAVAMREHNQRVGKNGQAQQPLSPASYCSSMEMGPYRPAISPSGSLFSKGNFGEPNHSPKTSAELLKVLNRIWNLEERHALDMSLVKTLRKELDESQAQIQELLQEKTRDQTEIDNLMKQITEHKVARKKEQDRIKGAVRLVEAKVEDELKLRRNSEKQHHKLAKELSEMKSLLSNAVQELERERKARTLLEDLCDEFAKGIRDYEQEVRSMKRKSFKDPIGREGNDKIILHISEAWLDERTQMKLADAHGNSENQSALDKLCFEIEGFLHAKQSGNSGKKDFMPAKNPCESNILEHSSESFHFNEPASAPWKENDEDDSVNVGNQCSQLCRMVSLKQANDFLEQQGEITLDVREKEAEKMKMVRKEVQLQTGSDPSSSLVWLEEHANERKHRPVNEESTMPGTETFYTSAEPRVPKKDGIVQRSCWEGKNTIADTCEDLPDTSTGKPSQISEDKKLAYKYNCNEGSFDASTFTGLPSPVKKWISDVSAAGPDITEASSRWPKSIKPNSLKAKLMEARLEGQHSRARTS